jgi:hypothetical protein
LISPYPATASSFNPKGAPQPNAAYELVERYYADGWCSDDREYYQIVVVEAHNTYLAANPADSSSLRLG